MKPNRCRLFAVLLVCLLGSGAAFADNLIVNGGFSEPLDQGWQVSSTASEAAVERNSDEGSVRVSHSYQGNTGLFQVIPVADLNLEFSGSVRLHAEASKEGYTALANLTLAYFDADTGLLGKSIIYRAAGSPGWKQGNTQHLIPVKADSEWADYRLDLASELAKYLTGIEPDEVRFVEVSLNADCGNKDGC